MPGVQAARLCPQAIFVWSGPAEYHKYSRMVTQIIEQKIPVVEKASIDEFYLDLSGMDKYFSPFSYLVQLKQQIHAQTGLPLSFALAANKLISKIATNEAKPNGQIEIPAGTEQAWLAPLPVAKMPGCGSKTLALLQQQGINTIGQLAATPPARLQKWLGKWGLDLADKARGIDDSPVQPHHEAKSISAEETFAEDTDDLSFLEQELARLTEKVGYQLRQEGKLAGCVAIKLRYENFETLTRQQIIPFTSSDRQFIQKARELLHQHYQRGRKLRLLGVRLSQLEANAIQLQLFDDASAERLLHTAIDDIKNTFGKHAIGRASSMAPPGSASRLPGQPLWINRTGEELD